MHRKRCRLCLTHCMRHLAFTSVFTYTKWQNVTIRMHKKWHTDSLMLTACWVITDEVASSCKLVLCLVMTSYTELVNERCAQLYLHYSLLSQTDIKFWKLSSKNDDLYVILDYRTAVKNKKLKYLEIPAVNFGVDRFPISRAFSIGNFRWPWFRDLG